MTYRLSQTISNPGKRSLIPELAFSPDGSVFAVSFQECNEVRLFDTATKTVLRTLRNPQACLGEPHAVAISDNHLLVSNRNYFTRPSQINVYRLDCLDDRPVQCHVTPFEEFLEPHSMALSKNRLLTTYCEGDGQTGGLVAYRFDDAAGTIGEATSVVKECFGHLGDPKGVSFLADGTEVIVSFNSLKPLPPPEGLVLRARLRWYRNAGRSPAEITRRAAGLLTGKPRHNRKPLPILANGLATFAISNDGVLSEKPRREIIREDFCRLENVHCVGDTCAVSDTINGQVSLYDLASDPEMKQPVQIIHEALALPHGVKLSPDKRLLLISNYSLKTWRQNILWHAWSRPRQDTVAVFELH